MFIVQCTHTVRLILWLFFCLSMKKLLLANNYNSVETETSFINFYLPLFSTVEITVNDILMVLIHLY